MKGFINRSIYKKSSYKGPTLSKTREVSPFSFTRGSTKEQAKHRERDALY